MTTRPASIPAKPKTPDFAEGSVSADIVTAMTRRFSHPAAALFATGLLLLSACGDSGTAPASFVDVPALPGSPTLAPDLPPLPGLDATSIASGAELYTQFCASCHGVDLEGDSDWMIPQADGSYLPPPHDSSGHTWHHGDALLVEIIADGAEFPETRMPTFGDQLTRHEIESILDFLKSTWGPEEREWQWEQTLRETAQE